MATIFIFDASDGQLIIEKVRSCTEKAALKIAERNNIRFDDCEWGSVSSIRINI
jgi:hypothetical protein